MTIEIRSFTASELELFLPQLARILVDCVAHGASVHFLQDIDQGMAEDFWQQVLKKAENDEVLVFGAFSNGVLAGTVTLLLHTPPNQQHRAEVSKLLVSPNFRRYGIGRALMRALERAAVEKGRSLLVLDTSTKSAAEALYLGLGWQKVGEIPNYSLSTQGVLLPASFFYKELVG
jgi:ribosomal protein S18 acetylase RimI-like enzyme